MNIMLTFATKQTVVSGQLKGHQEPLRNGSADAAHPEMLGCKCNSASGEHITINDAMCV